LVVVGVGVGDCREGGGEGEGVGEGVEKHCCGYCCCCFLGGGFLVGQGYMRVEAKGDGGRYNSLIRIVYLWEFRVYHKGEYKETMRRRIEQGLG
jgi:hypothetical protein